MKQIDFKKLPCNKLAHAVGLHQSQMSRALNRKATPGIHALYRLSRALTSLLGWEVSLGELYKQLYPDMVEKFAGVSMATRYRVTKADKAAARAMARGNNNGKGNDAPGSIGKSDPVLSKSIGP